jgi:hypothetical protein
MGKSKLGQLLTAFFLLACVLFGFLMTILVVQQLPQRLASNTQSPVLRLVIAFFLAFGCAAFFELGVWRLKQALTMDESKTKVADGAVYQQVAHVYRLKDILGNIFFIIVILAVSGFLVWVILGQPLSLTSEFIAYIVGYVVYVIARKPIQALLAKIFKSNTMTSTYTITPTRDAMTISNIAGMKRGQAPITIQFADIGEMRILTPIEAVSFLEYEVGPNLELAKRQTRDLYDFAKGKIPRPSVYTIGAQNTIGHTLLLRGRELFYMVNFANQDGADLLAAYNAYKQRETPPAPAEA